MSPELFVRAVQTGVVKTTITAPLNPGRWRHFESSYVPVVLPVEQTTTWRLKQAFVGMALVDLPYPFVLPTPESQRNADLPLNHPAYSIHRCYWVEPTPLCCINGDCDPENEQVMKRLIMYGMSNKSAISGWC